MKPRTQNIGMNRFDHHWPSYDHGYSGAASAWDTRTFIGADYDNHHNHGDDHDDENNHYSRSAMSHRRRPSASVSVIGYGDLENHRSRTRPPRDRDRDQDQTQDRNCDGLRVRQHRDGHRPNLKPSLSDGLTDLTSHHNTHISSLKQRLRSDRAPSTPTMVGTNGNAGYFYYYPPQPPPPAPPLPPRARSLSLSRSVGHPSPDDDEGDADDDSAATVVEPGFGSGEYHRHGRLSLSSPRAALAGVHWQRMREGSPEREKGWGRETKSELGRKDYGVYFRGQAEEDMRLRLGGGVSDSRVLPVRKARSADYERFARKGTSTKARPRAAS